ncbi:hypothetical protein SUGI_0539310 [Cryptomeria japonica]|nr:hypothetical protein SUGI_0539310 [Cryptomeria japonica]
MDFYGKFWSALGCKYLFTSLKTLEEKVLNVVHENRYSEGMDGDINEEDHVDQYFCEFSMHKQIRDMGRRIVLDELEKGPTKHSRVWREKDIRTLITFVMI